MKTKFTNNKDPFTSNTNFTEEINNPPNLFDSLGLPKLTFSTNQTKFTITTTTRTDESNFNLK